MVTSGGNVTDRGIKSTLAFWALDAMLQPFDGWYPSAARDKASVCKAVATDGERRAYRDDDEDADALSSWGRRRNRRRLVIFYAMWYGTEPYGRNLGKASSIIEFYFVSWWW